MKAGDRRPEAIDLRLETRNLVPEKRMNKNKKIRPLPTYPKCFVCGQDNPRGLRIQFAAEADHVFAEFVPGPFLAGYENVVHGGIASTLLDEAVIWAVYAFYGQFGVTAELTVRFRKPMIVNKSYRIIGDMPDDRKKMWIVEARIVDDKENLYTTGTGKVIPIDPESVEKFKERLVS
jgi:uncharacterized protein (TIGR00369 family)